MLQRDKMKPLSPIQSVDDHEIDFSRDLEEYTTSRKEYPESYTEP